MTNFLGKTVLLIEETFDSMKITFTDGTFIKCEAEGYEVTHLSITYTAVITRRAGEEYEQD